MLVFLYNQSMVRYKAIISYDGSQFSGFQKQSHARTIQEELEQTLLKLNSGQAVVVHGAGRTDAGVHAYGQVVHFDLPQKREVEKLRFALDTQTPEDIAVVSVEEVSDDFHARYQKHSKTYEFLVDTGRPRNPLMRQYATWYPYPLELKWMQEAIQDLVGTHDFTGFTASGTSVDNKVRTITHASVERQKGTSFLVFRFTGNGFLYKQVRNMVGTLLKIGNERMPVDQIKKILESKNRQLAGPTAAGNGLYLKEIRYESEENREDFFMDRATLQEQTSRLISEVVEKSGISSGQLFVLGLSSSEVLGKSIGKGSSVAIGEEIVSATLEVLTEKGIYLAVQGCEHLNRALAVEKAYAVLKNLEVVNVLPSLHAGGSGQLAAFKYMKEPVEVEFVTAQAGIDIGDTSIGMHVQHVQVPLRLSQKELGMAHVTALASRPKLIGGSRASHAEDLIRKS